MKSLAEIAVQIMAIFALMFTGIVVAVLWFTHISSKADSKKELDKKKIEIMDRHFDEMVTVECPYCGATYPSNITRCPTCGANIRKLVVRKA